MKWIAAGVAFAAVATAGTLIALGSASGAPADTTVSTGTTVSTATTAATTTTTTDDSTVSASSSASSSCVVSSSSVNGVATTQTFGCDASAQACSVVISATNTVTTTTQAGTCGKLAVHVDLRELRRLISSWIWFVFAASR